MKRFENILFIAEPGSGQAAAVERAVALAANNQARLTVLDIVAAPRLGPFADQHTRQEAELLLRRESLERLETLTAPHRGRAVFDLEVRIGVPFIEAIREVIEHDRDLVIKNAAGDKGLHGRLFGSTDMHLLRKCPCPVWLLRPDARDNYERIVAAVDFDPWEPDEEEAQLNQRILELAGSLALSDFAELHLVHVWEPLAERLVHLWSDEASEANVIAYVESERQHHRAGLKQLAAELREWLGAECYDYLSPQLHVHKGDPSEAIPGLTADLRADLVIMGTVARTGIPGFFIGNTAESVLYNLDCSVMAVKPSAFVSPVTPDNINQTDANNQ